MVTEKKVRNEERTLQPSATSSPASPWNEMERLFSEFGRHGWLHPFSLEWPTKALDVGAPFEGRLPKVDMFEREGEVVVHAELPGVRKGDVEVTLAENTVTIEAHTTREQKEEKGKYYRREMSRGDFRRTLTLPATVDEAKAKATFSDGVLELTLPKVEKTPGRKVEVD